MYSPDVEMRVDIEIEYTDVTRMEKTTERTVTDRVMPMGARVLVRRELSPGSNVLLRTMDGKFHALSIVKESQPGADRVWRVVIEFLGRDWRRNWLYPRDPKELLYQELLDASKNAYEVLSKIQNDLSEGSALDPIYLAEVKRRVDNLRNAVFNTQRAFTTE